MNHHYMKNLATLAVKIGVNIQKGQKLVINSPIDCRSFAHEIAEAAFHAGAGDISVNYSDEVFAKIRYTHAETDVFKTVPQWLVDKNNQIIDDGAAVISIHAADPDLMASVDPEKLKTAAIAMQTANADYSQAMMTNRCRWCVVSVPTAAWAKKVFPDLSEDAAVEKLWDAIFKATRADQQNPVTAWQNLDESFTSKTDFLNKHQFATFRYKSSNGTALDVGMPDAHIWSGGSEPAADGVVFFPNIPTEEVFCAPHKDRINGKLVSTYPLVYNGQLIDNFSLSFKDGKVCEITAETGYDALKNLVESDEGSAYLGEIALVPYHSPISDMGILFYNTLFDENASCHFALGSAYPTCVTGGSDMTIEELKAVGLNYSTTHVDFMIGAKDLSIIGISKDGHETKIFENGDWVI